MRQLTKIGIYPGAFDPVHDGHVAFAQAALTKHKLDKVFFMPEPTPRHKQGVKSLEHRVKMVQLAIHAIPEFGLIQLEQSRFTVHETWPLITARFKGAQMYMLLGSDVASRLASWPNINELTKTAPHFVIGLRGNGVHDAKSMLETLQHTTKLVIDYSLLASEHPGYGSSKIRQSLRKGHIPHGLHPDVLAYIKQSGLYISGAV